MDKRMGALIVLLAILTLVGCSTETLGKQVTEETFPTLFRPDALIKSSQALSVHLTPEVDQYGLGILTVRVYGPIQGIYESESSSVKKLQPDYLEYVINSNQVGFLGLAGGTWEGSTVVIGGDTLTDEEKRRSRESYFYDELEELLTKLTLPSSQFLSRITPSPVTLLVFPATVGKRTYPLGIKVQTNTDSSRGTELLIDTPEFERPVYVHLPDATTLWGTRRLLQDFIFGDVEQEIKRQLLGGRWTMYVYPATTQYGLVPTSN